MCRLNLIFLLLLAIASSSHSFDDEEALTWSRRADDDDDDALTSLTHGLDAQNEQSLLMWALEHSDPEVLAHAASSSSSGGEAEIEADQSLEAKRARVKLLREILEQRGQVSETQAMKDIINRLTSPPDDETSDSVALDLRSLLALVESIDNANDLRPLGALPLLVQYLDSKHSSEIQSVSAAVIGKAAGNNVKFQLDLIEIDPKIIGRLISMTGEALDQRDDSLALQGLYALSNMVINVAEHRKLFIDLGGDDLLLSCLDHQVRSHKLLKKAVTFISDLHDHGFDMSRSMKDKLAPLISEGIVKRGGDDDDYVEKALHLVLSLLHRDQEWIAMLSMSNTLADGLEQIQRMHQSEEYPNEELIKLIREAITALSGANGREEL